MKSEKQRRAAVESNEELKLLLLNIERSRDLAMAGGHNFLGYLLGMARIEAANIFDSNRKKLAPR